MTMAEAHDYLQRQRRRPSRRSFLKGVGAATGLLVAGPTLWRQTASWASTLPAGVHLAHGADPSTQMTLSWSSPPGVSPALRYGPRGSGLGAFTDVSVRDVAGVSDRLYHRAVFEGLQPSTTYDYEVEHPGGGIKTGSFTTPASAGQPFRFAALGDMGASDAGRAIAARIDEADPDVVFFVGDLCYADRLGGAADPLYTTGPLPGHQDLAQWDLWLAQIEASASRVPWMFTTGNHELEVGQGPLGYDGFLARMPLPTHTEGHPYYAFRHQNVGFVALDGNDVSYQIRRNNGYTGPAGSSAQDVWLEQTLAALRADRAIDFIVVGFHFCMYCSNVVHGSDGGPRDRWGHLFDRYAVDVVVNGHNHSYERTHPVRAGEPTRDDTAYAAGSGVDDAAVIDTAAQGTVYVTAGAGGQAAYPSTVHPVSKVTRPGGVVEPEVATWSATRYLGDHSMLVVDVEPARGARPAVLRCEARAAASDADGSALVVDRFVIERHRDRPGRPG